MSTGRQIIISLALVLLTLKACAQDLNVDGLRIKVCSDQLSMISLPDDVTTTVLGCNAGNYKINYIGSRVSIKANIERPASPCNLVVEEGVGDEKRTHRFVLVFVPGKDAVSQDDCFTNLSTKIKLAKCIGDMEADKAAANEVRTKQAETTPEVKTTTETPPQQANEERTTAKPTEEQVEIDGMVIERAEYIRKVEQRLKEFAEVVKALAGKDGNKTKALQQGMTLFNNDESRSVEVSGKEGVNTFSIRKYFDRLLQLHFNKVEVDNSTIQFISDLHQNENGGYSGHVVFLQHFKGQRGEQPVYTSTTEKSAEVFIEVEDIAENGVLKKKWKVFLGNITVTQS